MAQALGREGSATDGVYKVSFPRTDLRVKVGRVPVEAGAALGSWAAFRRSSNGAIVHGDLVLLESEVNPVVSALQHGGLEITAIHNHLIREQPSVMYVHFFGEGEAQKLASTVRSALDKTATPAEPAPAGNVGELPWKAEVERQLGGRGEQKGKVLAFSFPRPEAVKAGTHSLPPAMGMATVINFQAAPVGVAATGDFVLTADEVNPVIRELRAAGVNVTALHNHLLHDEPDLFFLHFWAEGDPKEVSASLRRALNQAGARKKK